MFLSAKCLEKIIEKTKKKSSSKKPVLMTHDFITSYNNNVKTKLTEKNSSKML